MTRPISVYGKRSFKDGFVKAQFVVKRGIHGKTTR
jgi:hypothetical protein